MLFRWHQWITSPRGFYISVVFYLCAVWALRSSLFAGVGGDDAEQLIFSQRWALGYGTGNPPLYTWAAILLNAVFGVGIGATEALKFGLLATTYVLLYQAARLLFTDVRIVALAALTPVAFYFVAWEAVLGFTHSIALIAMVAGFYLCLLKLETDSRWRAYLWLGLIGGLGLLAKYNFGLIAIALLAAAATDTAYRRKFMSLKFALACLLAAAIFAPHAYWMAHHLEELGVFTRDRLMDDTMNSAVAKRLQGIFLTLRGALNFLLPLLIFLVPLFSKAFLPSGTGTNLNARQHRIIGRTYLIVGLLILAGILLFGIAKIRAHVFFIMILFPLFIFARIEAMEFSPLRHRLYAVCITIVALLVPAGLIVKFAVYPQSRFDTNLHISYATLAGKLQDAGFKKGTIFADGYP